MKIGNGGKLKKFKRRSYRLFLKARKKLRRKRNFALCLVVAIGLISLLCR